MVILSHYKMLGYLTGTPDRLIFGRTIEDIGAGMGYYGVAVFFVVSGFLITSITLRRYDSLKSINCSEFWWFRFARIMPMLFLCISAIVALHLADIRGFRFSGRIQIERTVTSLLSFRFNEIIGDSNVPDVWNPLWSLSVEEMFYLGFPIVCLYLTGPGSVLWVFLVLISTSLYFKIGLGVGPFTTWACVHLLALGSLTAILQPSRLGLSLTNFACKVLGGLLAVCALGLVVAVVIWKYPFNTNFGPLICGLGGVLGIIASQVAEPVKFTRMMLSPISQLGVLSYEAYLVHLPTQRLLQVVGLNNPWLHLICVFCLSMVLHLSYAEPVNRLLRGLSRDAEAGWKAHALPLLKFGLPPFLAVGVLALGIYHYETKHISVQFSEIAALPEGTVEPIAYVGHNGSADLVFIKHETINKVRIGIDHWGSPGSYSGLIESKELLNGPIYIDFGWRGTVVTKNDTLVVRNSISTYENFGKPVLGKNDIGFSYAIPTCDSRIALIRR